MLQERALELLRSVSPYGTPLENHCLRLAHFTMALSGQTNTEVDEDLVFAGCYLHDIGLLVRDDREKNYLKRGLLFAAPKIKEFGIAGEAFNVLKDIMLYSHSIKEVPGISDQGELVRMAVRVEHSFGKITGGLSRDRIHTVFTNHPRRGFNRVLAGFFKTAIIEDGLPELIRVFYPK